MEGEQTFSAVGPFVAEDFDGTTGDDIAMLEPAGRVVIHRWTGSDFNNISVVSVGPSPSAIVAGNIAGNGAPDLVVANSGDGTISVLVSQGGGTFIRQTPDPSVGQVSPCALALGDMDADGDRDVVTANCGVASSVSVLLNDGNGSFSAGSYELTAFPLNVPSEAVRVETADLNQDGALDIIIGHATVESDGSHVSVILAQP